MGSKKRDKDKRKAAARARRKSRKKDSEKRSDRRSVNWFVDDVVDDPDRGRTVRLTDEGAEVLRTNIERLARRFEERWGRPMERGDPLFPDFDADSPQPLSDPKIEATFVDAMRKAGFDPAIIYAYQHTGMLVTTDNLSMWSDEDLAEWDEAIERYHRLVEE